MKQNRFFIYILAAVFSSMSLFTACESDDEVAIPVSSCKIEFNQAPDKYEMLEANTNFEIPVSITSEKGIKSAFYKVVTKPSDKLLIGAQIDIPVSGNKAETTVKLRVPVGLNSLVFAAFDADGVVSYRSVTIDSVKVKPARQLKDVEMSTDPADNKYFLALYESTPIFGSTVASTKQNRIDWVLTKTGSGVQPISPHAYGAGQSYYDNSKAFLAGFTELTYMFLSAKRNGIVQSDFDAVITDSDLSSLISTKIITGENYNILTASRRVGDTFNTTTKANGGFIIGWGSHTHPTVTPSVANNKAFGIVWVKSVTQKANGHYIIKFDVKYPSFDERGDNNTSSIVPYSPYPL